MSERIKPNRHLVLMGMMGSGKSTIGPILAQALGRPFIDLDEEVARRAQKPIPAIFAEEGEAGFRCREVATLAAVLAGPPAVVALGGGTVEEPGARRLVESEWVVWLDAPPEVLRERVGADSERPMLRPDPARRLRELDARRRPWYQSLQRFRVRTDTADPSTVAAQVVDAWRAQAGPSPLRVEAPAWQVSAVVPRSPVFRWGDWLDLGPAPGLVVADPAVAEYAGTVTEELLAEGARVGVHWLEGGESAKAVEALPALWAAMGEAGLTRDSWVVAVGGGVVTDVAGFAAATYLRGVPWAAVPTTLLGQVDAAIGGKVAVNLPAGKNLVGAFYLPRLVLLDLRPLSTLPAAEWRAGLGEVVKSALIAGGWLWEALCRGVPPIGQIGPEWEAIIRHTAAVKVEVVRRDPFEAHERMFLNFGHTVGHALEQVLGYGTLKHGEAVGLGCLVALRLSERRFGLDPAVRATVGTWLSAWGLPTRLPHVDASRLQAALRRDKKARGFGLQWILLKEVGRPEVVRDVPWEWVAEALAELGLPAEG
ncbi:MAG: 3-dehydroquinate synthase [Firmicutes bacterium]|nr:3-dehydroquinate synthase [Alicyclobacillaceae bacterium]MCL6496658.1 3-dehydroquinate synthase [Bacillota bacterium]